MSPCAKVSGFNLPRFAKSAIVPGCGIVPMSGGLPPLIAVEMIVGASSPAPWYLTLTPGFNLLNPARTALNEVCSSPVHLAMIERFPETPCCLCAPPALVAPASAENVSTSESARAQRYLVMQLPLSSCPCRRSRDPTRDRRSGARTCRQRHLHPRPHARASAR